MSRKVKYPKELVESVIKKHDNQKDCIIELFGSNNPNRYTHLYNLIKKYEIDTSHFLNQGELLKRTMKKNGNWFREIPLRKILIENSSFSRAGLKRRLFSEGLKKNICEICGQDENWGTGKISMVLDHINGIYNDNRLENLRIICPNCNSTLPTHCGRNRKNKDLIKNAQVVE
jgi:hypothetical protein